MNDSNWRKATEEEDRLIKEYVQLDTSEKESFSKKNGIFFLILSIIFIVCTLNNDKKIVIKKLWFLLQKM